MAPRELPEGDELARLLDLVDDLADSIEESTDLPEEVKQVLRRRLTKFASRSSTCASADRTQPMKLSSYSSAPQSFATPQSRSG